MSRMTAASGSSSDERNMKPKYVKSLMLVFFSGYFYIPVSVWFFKIRLLILYRKYQWTQHNLYKKNDDVMPQVFWAPSSAWMCKKASAIVISLHCMHNCYVASTEIEVHTNWTFWYQKKTFVALLLIVGRGSFLFVYK